MRLSTKQISHIDKKIVLDGNRFLVEINVSENDGVSWSDDECNYNIYCVDQHYNIIWQVKEIETKPVSISGETDSFCYLGKDESDEFIADRFSGFVYKINPDTGEATRIGFHK
jgi:hypothetical protein